MGNGLPQSRYFALTWGIPDGYGGMTAALLERSRAFVRHMNTPVDVLTFEDRSDNSEVERNLRSSGALVDGMRLLNLWDWLRSNPEQGSGDITRVFTPLQPDGSRRTLTRYAADGSTVLQVDHYRADGSLLVSDRKDVDEPGTLGGRSVVLCDADGKPVRSWGTARGLYRYWLDRLIGHSAATLMIDSKTVAAFLVGYRKPRVTTIHIVHSSHLVGTKRPFGPIRASRAAVFADLAGFDAVVVLTERQRDDITALLGEQLNVLVVPNGRDVEPGSADSRGDRGIVIGSLTTRKRVDHAIAAVARSERVTELDVYGDGELREELEQRARDNGQAASVTFHGHAANASRNFRTASFMLLTSTSEGFPLALVEAMASGCIPIAYDVPYGPADLIRDGENGYLVEPGDIDGLAAAIDRFTALPVDRERAMRAAAIATGSAFSDERVTALWAQALTEVHARRQPPPRAPLGGRVVRRLRRIAARYRG